MRDHDRFFFASKTQNFVPCLKICTKQKEALMIAIDSYAPSIDIRQKIFVF